MIVLGAFADEERQSSGFQQSDEAIEAPTYRDLFRQSLLDCGRLVEEDEGEERRCLHAPAKSSPTPNASSNTRSGVGLASTFERNCKETPALVQYLRIPLAYNLRIFFPAIRFIGDAIVI